MLLPIRRIIATILIITLTCLFWSRIYYLLWRATPSKHYLWLASTRIQRKLTHGPAPFWGCDVPEENLVPNSYCIMLRPGHSMQQHRQRVGRSAELNATIQRVFDDFDPRIGSMYFAKIEDASLMDSIRADPGVDLVECFQVSDDIELAWISHEVDENGEPGCVSISFTSSIIWESGNEKLRDRYQGP